MKSDGLLRDVKILDCSPDALKLAHGMPVCDSRKVTKGCVFTCITGIKDDGHGHISEAVRKGAAVIVAEKEVALYGAEYVRVPDTRLAFAEMCNAACGYPGDSMHLCAVTGTNGKSSVVGILSDILNTLGEKSAVIGTIENCMTTPSPDVLYPILAEYRKSGIKYISLEASSHALSQNRLAPLRFDVGVYTNLTPEHLDYHKTVEEYARCKSRLFEQCTNGVFCSESEYALECAREHGMKKWLYGFERGDFLAEKIKEKRRGYTFGIRFPGYGESVYLPLVGRYQILNTLAASGCAYILGAQPCDISAAIPKIHTVPGRLEEIDTEDRGFRIFIDYAHTPDAMYNAITSVKAVMKSNEKLTAVFGCGGDRDRSKRSEMGRIASSLADRIIITSDNPRTENPYDIIKEIVSGCDGGAKRLIIENRVQAVQYAVKSAREGDILLFLGKGHENYTEDINGKHEYNEKKTILESLTSDE